MSNIETVFTGKNYRIDWDGVFYVLATGASDDEKFDSLNELIEAHPVCAEARQAIVGKSEADELITDFPNVADLMTKLDSEGYFAEQDWENGATTWTLDDGSEIRVCGNEAEAIG